MERGTHTLVGKACPELYLADYMVQGDLITQADWAGKVVYLDLYQATCAPCERHSMPYLQDMYEQYRDNPDVIVLAVVTAHEKDANPEIADDAVTRTRLEERGWTMPCARDLDELTVPLLRRPYPLGTTQVTGTPIALVIDAFGYVRAHEVNNQEAASDALQQAFEAALAEISHPELRDVAPALEAAKALIDGHKYMEARAAAEVLQSQAEDDEARKDAAYLVDVVDALVEKRMQMIERQFALSPLDAIQWSVRMASEFEGHPAVANVEARIRAWTNSDAKVEYDKLQGEYYRLRKEILDGGHFLYGENAETILRKAEFVGAGKTPNRIAEWAGLEAWRLRQFLEAPGGYLGMRVYYSKPESAVLVGECLDGSPAARAGLRLKDRILSVDGVEVTDPYSMNKVLNLKHAGDIVRFDIRRADETLSLEVTLARPLE